MTHEIETVPSRPAEAAARATYRQTALALAAGKELNAKELAAMTDAMNLLGYGWEGLEQDVRAIGSAAALQKAWSDKTVEDLQKVRDRAVKVRDALQEKLTLAECEIHLANHRLRKWTETSNALDALRRRHPRVFAAVNEAGAN